MFFAVINVKPLGNYLFHLTFKNREEKVFDMKPYLEIGVSRSLKDENTFKTAKVSFDTVEWGNKVDIDPEILYAEAVNAKALS